MTIKLQRRQTNYSHGTYKSYGVREADLDFNITESDTGRGWTVWIRGLKDVAGITVTDGPARAVMPVETLREARGIIGQIHLTSTMDSVVRRWVEAEARYNLEEVERLHAEMRAAGNPYARNV